MDNKNYENVWCSRKEMPPYIEQYEMLVRWIDSRKFAIKDEIRRGIFQGHSVSPMIFVLGMIKWNTAEDKSQGMVWESKEKLIQWNRTKQSSSICILLFF